MDWWNLEKNVATPQGQLLSITAGIFYAALAQTHYYMA
jgi:predicted secreted hydrolase